MGCNDLLKLIKNMSSPSGDNESNSLWTVYYSQYLHAIYVILDTCDNNSYVNSDEIFLPLCFLVSHYMELWGKTISKNFGMGDFSGDKATLVSGHHIDALFDHLGKKAYRDKEIHEKILHVKKLYKILQDLTYDNIPMSEAMRYPVDKKETPTLSRAVSDTLEWQDFSFNFDYYTDVIKELMSETIDIYDLAFQEKIH